MKTRIVTGSIFTISILVILALIYNTPVLYSFIPLILVIAFSWEMNRALTGFFKWKSDSKTLKFVPVSVVIIINIMVLLSRYKNELNLHIKDGILIELSFVAGAFLFLILPLILMLKRHKRYTITESLAISTSIFYVLTPTLAISLFALEVKNAVIILCYMLFATWTCDVFAYVAGSLLGKRKIVPHISPNKTWAGFIGGIIGSIIFTVLWMGFSLYQKDFILNFSPDKLKVFYYGIFFGFLMGTVSQFGDWLASCIKRSFGIKDFSNAFPGHGGFLDRFDGVVLSSVLVLFVTSLISEL